MNSRTVSSLLLSNFNRFLSDQTGLYFDKDKQNQLLKGMEAAAKEFGFGTAEECIRQLMSSDLSREQIEILAAHLTVGETYFFREKKSYDFLENRVLPELILSRRESGENRLRVWSAACSSGEEAYSIAIVLDEMKEKLTGFNTFILATDINRGALKKAREGIYSEWSFRGISQWTKDRYFTRTDNKQYEIVSHLKEAVVFDYLNLVEDSCPSLLHNTNGMDIIFCRNVLMYFSTAAARKVVNNLSRCLVPDGWLVVSPSDAFNVSDPLLSRMDIAEAPIFRKIPESEKFVKPAAVIEPKPYKPVKRPATPPVKPVYIPPRPAPPAEKPRESAGFNDRYEEASRFYRQGLYIKAVETAESLLASPIPTDNGVPVHKIYELLTRSYADRGKLSEAEKWCSKAIDAAKLDPLYRYLMATIQLEQGKTEAAAASLKQGLYIDRDYIPAHFTLGHIALQQGKYTEAARCFDNTLSLLAGRNDYEPLMEMEEGLTVGRMKEIITALKEKEPLDG